MLIIMTICIVLVIAISLFLAVFRGWYRKKLEKELDEKIQDFQKQVSEFADELKNLSTHYVDKQEETAFLTKWNNLYKGIFRYCHLKKLNSCIDSSKFLADYRSIPDNISDEDDNRIDTLKREVELSFSTRNPGHPVCVWSVKKSSVDMNSAESDFPFYRKIV